MSTPEISGTLTFPGVTYPIRATVSRVLGVRPSTAVLYAIPQAGSPDCSGTATFRFGSTTRVLEWTNALCDSSTLSVRTRGGRLQVFLIHDRRWRWSKAPLIKGAYNVRDPSGNIIASTQKTLAELATILFTQLGDGSADVSLITSTELPEVCWEYEEPADELADLLESRGYVISLMTDNTFKVFPVGSGAVIPNNDDLITAAVSVDPPEIPELIRVIANRTMVQSKLLCLPVGMDVDYTVKSVYDLSYNPGGVGNTSGWDGIDLVTMAAITDPTARQLALETVGRWYQVSCQADGTQDLQFGSVDYVPGEIAVTSGAQFLPLKDFLLTTTANVFGQKKYDQAFVSGTFWDGAATNPPANLGPFYQLQQTPWFLMKDLGIVAFDTPETKFDAGKGKMVFADVYLTCAYSIHDNTTNVKDHYTKARNLGGYGEDSLRADYLQRTLIAEYTAGTPTLSDLIDNSADVDTAADLLLDNMEQKYGATVGNILSFRDIQDIDTDGVCRQVQWNIAMRGPAPFSTMACQNAEMLPLLPTSVEMLRARFARMNGSPRNRRNHSYKWSHFGKSAPGGGIP